MAMRKSALGVMGLIVTVATVTVGAQGFKSFMGQTDEVTLTRKRPPAVYLMGTEIAVRVTSQVAEGPQIADRIASALETELLKQDPRLKPNKSAPQSVIALVITKSETAERMTSRVIAESRKTGEQQVWNDKSKKYETKPVYSTVNVTHNYKAVTGSMSISYQALDERTKAALDSNNVNPTFSREYENGDGAPTPSSVQDILIQQALAAIVPRLVPTKETLKVLLGRDKRLDESNKLAQAGLWSKALEKLSTMAPYAKQQDDAYRLYNIGVANEAMAYDSDDVAVAKKLLEQASIQYGKALEMNPGEKYFREPQTRINTGIAAYKKVEEQQTAFAQLQEEQSRKADLARATENEGAKALVGKSPAATAPHTFNNADVISLQQSGLDETNLLAAITSEKNVAFDLSAQGLKSLLDAKISNRVIAAMRTKQTAQSVAAKKPASTQKATPTAKPGTPAKAPTTPPKKPGGSGGGTS